MVFPFEEKAAAGEPMPDGLSLPDQLVYQFLANLYDRIKRGTISREQAALEKGRMKHQYDLASAELAKYSALGGRWADLLKRAEGAQIIYRMDRTLKSADVLSAALDGVLYDYS